MNTNMTGFRWLSEIFAFVCFVKKTKPQHWKGFLLYYAILKLLENSDVFCLFQWEKALAVAPGVSMKYWKSLTER